MWDTIYHRLPVVTGVDKPIDESINLWEQDIYDARFLVSMPNIPVAATFQ